MFEQENDFVFIVTGVKDNESFAVAYAEDYGYKDRQCITYKLDYLAPYDKNFTGIKDFELVSCYHPFLDPIQKNRVAVIDLSEWVGHEEENYLDLFFKFLHDYHWSFYEYRYIFSVGNFCEKEIENLFIKASLYLNNGFLKVDDSLTNKKSMSSYLKEKYKVEKNLADELSEILVHKINGYTQCYMIMEDLINKMSCKEKKLTQKTFYEKFDLVLESKLGIIFGKELMICKERNSQEKIRS